MWTTKTKAVAALTAMTMAATAIVPLPAAAAPVAKPAPVKSAAVNSVAVNNGTDASTDFSSARRYRRGNNAAALAMFGAVAGTIGAVAIAQQRRKAARDYYRAQYGYGAYGYPGYGYNPRYGYYGPDYNYQGPAWTGPRAYGAPGGYYYGGKRPYQYTSPW